MGVIEEVLRIRDEASAALRKFAQGAQEAGAAFADDLNPKLKAGQDLARVLGGRFGELAGRAENLSKVLGATGGLTFALSAYVAAVGVAAVAGYKLAGAINDAVREAAKASEEFERLGLITAEQGKATREAADQLEAMEKAAGSASARLVGEFAPALSEVYKTGTQTTLALADLVGWIGGTAAAHPTLVTVVAESVGGMSLMHKWFDALTVITGAWADEAERLADALRAVDTEKAAKSLASNEAGLTGVGKGNTASVGKVAGAGIAPNTSAVSATKKAWADIAAERIRLEEEVAAAWAKTYDEFFADFGASQSAAFGRNDPASQQAALGALLGPQAAARAAGEASAGSNLQAVIQGRTGPFGRIAEVSSGVFDLLNATLPKLVEGMGPGGQVMMLLLQMVQAGIAGAAGGGGLGGIVEAGAGLLAGAAGGGFGGGSFKSRGRSTLQTGRIGDSTGRRVARGAPANAGITINAHGVMATDVDSFVREVSRHMERRGVRFGRD